MNDHSLYKNSFDNCPLTFALNLIGGKWRLPIIWALSKNGTMRYNELKRSIHGITNMMLTQSLRELELYGIINRKQYMEIPPRVEYSLTDNGKNLIPALKALAHWGKQMKSLITQNNIELESVETVNETEDEK
ncbi:winged helix-turn-helix transcriptional regulator [Thermosediminibacter litoriperuensis]|uniref:HxlR family transcriptional regulator n=1 Tax=Thermosediminibacter litoriperuensis TaxID=291989 RepID=A0A5S5ADT5_9FIRM|nr:helix-turn-helix domain-containing protein [Thermosediminibacter litoriperuensis]TYP47665.1 HxlR family transcriptional regulator [Thermosediminibacter litoriperuensis]